MAVYQGSHWTVGQIKDMDDQHLHVKTMVQSIFGRNMFKWDSRDSEESVVEIDDVICTVNAPTSTNSRGGHALSEDDFYKVSSLVADKC